MFMPSAPLCQPLPNIFQEKNIKTENRANEQAANTPNEMQTWNTFEILRLGKGSVCVFVPSNVCQKMRLNRYEVKLNYTIRKIIYRHVNRDREWVCMIWKYGVLRNLRWKWKGASDHKNDRFTWLAHVNGLFYWKKKCFISHLVMEIENLKRKAFDDWKLHSSTLRRSMKFAWKHI